MGSAGEFGPGKRGSLWDIMMNYAVFGLCTLLKQLALTERDLVYRVQIVTDAKSMQYMDQLRPYLAPEQPQYDRVNEQDLQHVKGWLQFAKQQADTLELQAVHDRLELFNGKLRFAMSLTDFLGEVRALREAFKSGLRFKQFYLYPEAKGQACIKAQHHWAKAFEAFPRIKDDALAAVDCYGLGHNTASVFYSMRVVEHGLRALAAGVNVTFDVQQWHTVLNEIESAIRELAEKWPKTATKSEWLGFYSEAAKEFFYFKDGWRNYVSHGGDPYDEHQALSVFEHVRAFMAHLGSRLGEKTAVVPAQS